MITFLRAQRTRILWLAIIIGFIGVGLAYFYKTTYSDPRRVFNAMLENSLRTSSVLKQVTQVSDNQTLDQRVRLQLGGDHVAQSVTTLSQTGLASANVMTESIGTPNADFVRYRSIKTDQKNEAGEEIDFSNIVDVWGRTEASETTSGELYNELVLGVIPIGNLSHQDRKELLQDMTELDVYKVEYENVKRGSANGRPAYSYRVKIRPETYVTLLKKYATKVGLSHLDNINPQNYSSAPPIEFTISVDIMTRRLVGIEYDSGRQEYYTSYGTEADVELPNDTVPVEELQDRLRNIE
jgi:hypothetical protein